jgi:hypothetical protein
MEPIAVVWIGNTGAQVTEEMDRKVLAWDGFWLEALDQCGIGLMMELTSGKE